MPRRRRVFAGASVLWLAFAAGCGSDADLTADAGTDFTVAVGEAPIFDGCGSEGDISNYRWVIQDAPSSVADDIGKAIREEDDRCSFPLETAMVVDEVGTWTIELTVRDTDGNSSSDTVDVEVTG